MAYQNYYQPNFYSPPMPDQLAQFRQNYQSPMIAQPIPQSASPMAGTAMVWVPGFQAAQEYLVAPNSAVALWDSNAPVVYLKQADSSGKPSLTVYDLVERTAPRAAPEVPQIDTSAFITREEFAQLAERVEALTTKPKRAAMTMDGRANLRPKCPNLLLDVHAGLWYGRPIKTKSGLHPWNIVQSPCT